MNNFFMAVIIGLIFILTFAGFFLINGTGSFVKKKQNADGAKKAFERTIKTVCSLYNFETTGPRTIRFGDEQYTFDEILLSEYGTIAVNAVYRKGDIYGSANDEEWICVPDTETSRKERFANPVKTQNGCVRFFKEMYKQEKAKCGNADSLVVFPFGKCILYITPKQTGAFTLAGLKEKLGEAKYTANNKADIAAMKAALEKYTVK